LTEHSAGGIVVHGQQVLLIHDRYGRWTFPKGHVEAGETPEQAAVREVWEETGVRATAGRRLGQIGYALPSGNDKQVAYYYMTYEGGEIRPLEQEVREARWLSFDDAQEHVQRYGYPGYRALLRKAVELSTG